MSTIKSAFIHIPKTGGTTLINTPLYVNHHWKEIEDHSTILENEENNSRIFDNVFTYTIMRNPFERMLSCFYSSNNNLNGKEYDHIPFSEYVKIITGIEYDDTRFHKHWATQMSYIKDVDDKVKVDYVGRTEDLLNSVNEILESIGATERLNRIKWLNKSGKRTHYSDYYDDETIKCVEKYYEEDLDFLKIKFEKEKT